MTKKRIAILGSTGSIGTQALEIIRNHSDKFQVEVLTGNGNAELLVQQALEFKPNAVVIADKSKCAFVQEALSNEDIKVFAGEKSLEDIVEMDTIDMVLVALVGFSGLKPTLNAIQHKKCIALANKETMVVAGNLVTQKALEKKVPILPVDSEHSAIFQSLIGENFNKIQHIYLTASGGPFRGKSLDFLEKVTVEQALRHPNWVMGKKVTIDSATLMNKGLEVIEAKWFFDLSPEQIKVIVHPESVIHSLVEFEDGSLKAQLGIPSMQLPIQYAFSFPERISSNQEKFSFAKYPKFSFEEADTDTFRCLQLAYTAMEKGGNLACVMNAANEIAVEAFLQSKIKFTQIPQIIEDAMSKMPFIQNPSLEDYLQTDEETRTFASFNLVK